MKSRLWTYRSAALGRATLFSGRVTFFDPTSCQQEDLPGFSGHTKLIDLSIDSNTLAVVEDKTIGVHKNENDAEFKEGTEQYALGHCVGKRQCHYSAFTLAFCNRSLVVFSNKEGGCYYIDRSNGTQIRQLTPDCPRVFAMTRLGYDSIATLSTAGELRIWRPPDREPVRSIAAPGPPPAIARVPLVYWPGAHAVVWPALGGALVRCHLQDGRITCSRAHNQNFYTIFRAGDDVVTICQTDRKLRRWPPSSDKPALEVEIPVEVSTAVALDTKGQLILLIARDGGASVWRLSRTRFKHLHSLEGSHYVTLVEPLQLTQEAVEGYEEASRAAPTTAIVKRLLEPDCDDDEEPHAIRPSESFHDPVVADLPQALAGDPEDLFGAIKSHAEFAGALGDHLGEVVGAMCRYGALLESVWQLDAAREVYQRILAIHPGHPVKKRVRKLRPYLKAMSEGECVLTAGVSVEHIMEAGEHIGNPLSRPVAVELNGKLHCRGALITAEAIIQKYAVCCSEDRANAWPDAVAGSTRWLSPTRIEQVDLVIFHTPAGEARGGVQFGAKVYNAGLDTVIEPVVLFDCSDPRTAHAAAEFLDGSESAAGITPNAVGGAWLERMHTMLNHVLRRLVTEDLSAGGTKA